MWTRPTTCRYYLQSLVGIGSPPDELIDHNVRIDYGKLRHLIQIDRRLNGNFSRLREIIETGEQVGEIKTSFPVEGLLQQENFISLLYYFGLLTFAGEREGRPLLKIPNRTVSQFMYDYLREAYQEIGVFRPSAWDIADRLNHAYLIELKYLNRGDDTPAKRQRLITEAEAQLGRYCNDSRVVQHLGPATLHPIVLLYSGWELVYRAELEPSSAGED